MFFKKVKNSGAQQNTASKSLYSSWLNNTYKGTDAQQTMTNIEFFAYMRAVYGMKLDIYAWDVGNLDGINGDYQTLNSLKIKSQFPNGYAPIVKSAALMGTRMGVWALPDGYGNIAEQQKERRETFLKLCKDYNFALFKFDKTGDEISKDNISALESTINKCREFTPDLITLNYGNNFKKSNRIFTASLLNNQKTYVDVNVSNPLPAPHNRAFALTNGLTKRLNRLADDNGVSLSSCLDYFEDELIYHAFGRSLILAPEIYGNPWFLRDDEYSLLARIFNLHKRYASILVNAKKLPNYYGSGAVSRGDGNRRFICVTNPSWQTKNIKIKINKTLGLKKSDTFGVIRLFPTETMLGKLNWNDTINVEINPFRAALFEVVNLNLMQKVVGGAEYTVLSENKKGEPEKIKIVKSNGDIIKYCGNKQEQIYSLPQFDNTECKPLFLGRATNCAIPLNDRKYYETNMYSVTNDSLERQSIYRSGSSKINVVNNARKAFFDQKTYLLKGCDSAALFDENDETFFDAESETLNKGYRIDGGALRVDLGVALYINALEIEYFESEENFDVVNKAHVTEYAEYSPDLEKWNKTEAAIISDKCEKQIIAIDEIRKKAIPVKGKIKSVKYHVNGIIRYFCLNNPMSRIYNVKVLLKGVVIRLPELKANILMAPYNKKKTVSCKSMEVNIPENATEKTIVCCIGGKHGVEGVYCVAECDGKLYGFPKRASSYPAVVWENRVIESDSNYSYFLKVPKEACGKKMKLWFLYNTNSAKNTDAFAYLVSTHGEQKGVILDV